MDQGEKGMKLKNYMYRVEFQNRLAPHIHGCAWMQDSEIDDFRLDGTVTYDEEKLPSLIDKYVSCELPDDPQFKNPWKVSKSRVAQKLVRKGV